MEHYIVSARKYRPSSFSTVVGQQALAHTLKSAIDSGRLAHAYLFCGPRGVGKTSCARIFAKTINCEHLTADGEACNECESCRAFNEGRSYNIVELDAASNNSVDDMRNLTDQVRIPPQIGKYKVFIIDEVHMLTTSAFNAFLKTLEEPPAHAIFILATTEKHKIIPTILSRCQIYDFARISVQDIVEQLKRIAEKEGITAEPQALDIIAQKADGAMRDALSIFDQVAASSQGNITYRSAIENLNILDYEYYFQLVEAFLKGDVPQALLQYKEIRDHGFDSLFFINGLASHIRDLMVASNTATLPLLEVSADVAVRYNEQAQKCPVQFLYKAMSLCNDCDLNYRVASNKQFLVELTLIKICQIMGGGSPDPNGGKTPLKQMNNGTAATAAPAQPTNTPSAAPHASMPKENVTPKATVSTPAATVQQSYTRYEPKRPVLQKAPATVHIGNLANLGKVSETHEESESKTVVQSSYTRLKEQYTPQKLDEKWNLYIQTHPKNVVMINTMRMSKPVPTGKEFDYTLMVDNLAQRDMVGAHMLELLTFLRKELHNDYITISIVINENTVKTKILSPQDIVADMMIRSDAVKEFVEKFKLSIY